MRIFHPSHCELRTISDSSTAAIATMLRESEDLFVSHSMNSKKKEMNLPLRNDVIKKNSQLQVSSLLSFLMFSISFDWQSVCNFWFFLAWLRALFFCSHFPARRRRLKFGFLCFISFLIEISWNLLYRNGDDDGDNERARKMWNERPSNLNTLSHFRWNSFNFVEFSHHHTSSYSSSESDFHSFQLQHSLENMLVEVEVEIDTKEKSTWNRREKWKKKFQSEAWKVKKRCEIYIQTPINIESKVLARNSSMCHERIETIFQKLPRFLQAKRDLNQQTRLSDTMEIVGRSELRKRSVIKRKFIWFFHKNANWKIESKNLHKIRFLRLLLRIVLVRLVLSTFHCRSDSRVRSEEAFKFFHFTTESINFNVVLLPMTYCCIVWCFHSTWLPCWEMIFLNKIQREEELSSSSSFVISEIYNLKLNKINRHVYQSISI